jgi:hypothetical protein
MSDALGNPPSFGGNPREPVAEVDPDDVKTFWPETRNLQTRHPGQHFSIGFELKAICKAGANAKAVWYRSSMIWVLNRFAQGQLAPWIKDEEVSDAVFRTMATIPIEWVGHTEREGLPFDVDEFFRRLREGSVQNG